MLKGLAHLRSELPAALQVVDGRTLEVHRGELPALKVVNGLRIECLLGHEIRSSLELRHGLRHWNLNLWSEGGRILLEAGALESCWYWLEALCLAESGNESGNVLNRVTTEANRWLHRWCTRVEAWLSSELLLHHLLTGEAEGLLSVEAGLKGGTICAECGHLLFGIMIFC